jgi:hypothetical protein
MVGIIFSCSTAEREMKRSLNAGYRNGNGTKASPAGPQTARAATLALAIPLCFKPTFFKA